MRKIYVMISIICWQVAVSLHHRPALENHLSKHHASSNLISSALNSRRDSSGISTTIFESVLWFIEKGKLRVNGGEE